MSSTASRRSPARGLSPGKVYITHRLNQILVDADNQAKRLKDEYVSVEHLVLAIIQEGDSTAGGEDPQVV